MEPNTSSFWSDIKKYEDTLAKDPSSYCFAPLAELYRKVGLLDDALSVAKKGCDLHPDYIGGYMALGRVYFEKGMLPEGREALERVIRVTPDNLLAHKLLSQICMELGDVSAAEQSLRTVLSINPGDAESQVMLESSLRAGSPSPLSEQMQPESFREEGASADWPGLGGDAEGEIVLEEVEILEELSDEVGTAATDVEPSVDMAVVWDEEHDDAAPLATEPAGTTPDLSVIGSFHAEENEAAQSVELGREAPIGQDPLATATMAELYVSQGFTERAIGIYRDLLAANPHNAKLRTRIAELVASSEREEASERIPVPSGAVSGETFAGGEKAPEVGGEGGETPVVAVLERWLENIRRRR